MVGHAVDFAGLLNVQHSSLKPSSLNAPTVRPLSSDAAALCFAAGGQNPLKCVLLLLMVVELLFWKHALGSSDSALRKTQWRSKVNTARFRTASVPRDLQECPG